MLPERLGEGPPLMLPPPGLVQYPESLCESCDPSDEHAVPIGAGADIEKNLPAAPAGPPRWKVAPPLKWIRNIIQGIHTT